jgi:hypothetical protein
VNSALSRWLLLARSSDRTWSEGMARPMGVRWYVAMASSSAEFLNSADFLFASAADSPGITYDVVTRIIINNNSAIFETRNHACGAVFPNRQKRTVPHQKKTIYYWKLFKISRTMDIVADPFEFRAVFPRKIISCSGDTTAVWTIFSAFLYFFGVS